MAHPEKDNDAGLLPLTDYQPVTATSHTEGRDPLYAVDESTQTWWQPRADDPEKTLTVELGGCFDVSSARLIWRDVGMETLDGVLPGAFQYVLEYRDAKDGAWKTLVDASDNTVDLCVDYRTFQTVCADAIRLRITGAPCGIHPALISLTAFGSMS